MATDGVLAPGARVIVRDEEWLVRSSVPVVTGGCTVRVIGMSELVRNQERAFLSVLDDIKEMHPKRQSWCPTVPPSTAAPACFSKASFVVPHLRTTKFILGTGLR